MGLVDYSDIKDDIEGAQDQKILPAGTEVKARIIAVRSGISEKNDCEWYNVRFDIPNEPLAREFTTFFWDPLSREKLDPKQAARNNYQLKQFFSCFSVDISRKFSWEDDLPGLTGWVILGVNRDSNYGDQNTVSKFVVGK